MGLSVYIISFIYNGIKYTWTEDNARFESKTSNIWFKSPPIGATGFEIVSDRFIDEQ